MLLDEFKIFQKDVSQKTEANKTILEHQTNIAFQIKKENVAYY